MAMLRQITLSDDSDLEVGLLNYGARIHSLKFQQQEVALSYPNLSDYLNDEIYLGATVGPIANRLADGHIEIGDQRFALPLNEDKASLHSSGLGVDKWFWTIDKVRTNSAIMSLEFDMEDIGMAGQLECTATYSVNGNHLELEYKARCTHDTYLNFTNHVYLNLAGGGDISNHRFTLFADDVLEVDEHCIPNGQRRTFTTPLCFDLSHPDYDGHLDHHFHAAKKSDNGLYHYVSAQLSGGDLLLDIEGSSPGFQFYTGRHMSAPFSASGGFCVEPQYAPNAINTASLYSPILRAGDEFTQQIAWRLRG